MHPVVSVRGWIVLMAIALLGGPSLGVHADEQTISAVKVERGSGRPAELGVSKYGNVELKLGRRAGENDIVFTEQSVSRLHAALRCQKGVCALVDLGTQASGSMNGTFLNGVRLKAQVPMPVKRGDRIELGTEAELLLK